MKFVSWLKIRGYHIPLVVKVIKFFSQLLHINVWGPSRVTYVSGARCFLSLIDDFSRTTWIYLLKDRSETITIIRNSFNCPNTI